MTTTPSSQTTQSAIEQIRDRQTRDTAALIAAAAIPLYLIGALVDWKYGVKIVSKDAIGMLGATITLLLISRASKWRSSYSAPLYVTFWLNSVVALYYTGGVRSSFFVSYISLLFIGGLVLQTRLGLASVSGFTAANVLLWGVAELSGWRFEPAGLTPEVVIVLNLLTIGGIVVCVASFVKTQNRLASEAMDRGFRLTETQNQLSHTAKMAEIGDLVATTAHEMAQPLQVISTAASLIQRTMSKNEQASLESVQALLTRIQDGSTRLSRLLLQLKDFSRKDRFEPKVIDLGETVKAVLSLAEYDLRLRSVGFGVELSGQPVLVRADAMGLQQVLLNLINNARDSALSSERPRVLVQVTSDRGRARVFVKNSGPAIPLDIQAKLFSPYFTTKSKGKGTGLGLMICEQIVTRHGGRLVFSSCEDDTVFMVEIPLEDVSSAPAQGMRSTSAPSDRSFTSIRS